MSKHDWRLHHSPFSLISISHAPLRPQPRSESRVDRVGAEWGEHVCQGASPIPGAVIRSWDVEDGRRG